MLDKLKNGLRQAIEKITGAGYVDKDKVEELIRDLQRALLASDVDVKLVFELSETIRKRALEEKPKRGITLKEHVITVVYEELTNILGKEVSVSIKPGKILLIGLFGSGKTTSVVKLANLYRKRGLKPAVISCDTYRPAAMEQLEQLASQTNIPCFAPKDIKDQKTIATIGLEKFKKYDIIIFDSSGRDALDEKLATELKELSRVIEPNEILLTLPSDLGQAAGVQASEFNKLVGITGIIVTKLDATAKGGGALTSAKVTNAPVKFIGTGEKIDDFEVYDPRRFVARLIGFGDLETLLEKVKEVAKPELAEKIISEKFDLNDFCEQIETMQKTGPIDKILDMIGLSKLAKNVPNLDVQEKKMEKWKHIVKSMTLEERSNPEIINASRITRIAKGSGSKEEDVRELLASYKKIKKMIKMVKPGKVKDFTKLFKGFKI
ncbi:MAG: signal recognition particle receptor subunit alpha [Candidatus Aenigmatarchaeota archaeon]